jgi:hypothetical protein
MRRVGVGEPAEPERDDRDTAVGGLEDCAGVAAHATHSKETAANRTFAVRAACHNRGVTDETLKQEIEVDSDAGLRAKIHDLLGDVERHHGGRRIRRLELEQRADHVAVYATFLSHMREPPVTR